jgi:hypothetical protein
LTARAGLAASVVALTIGCGGGTPPPDLPDASSPYPVEVMLGGANVDMSGFTALDGDVTMVAGGQGGFHVWVKYRIAGAAEEMVTVNYTARRISDGRLILRSSSIVVMLGAPGSEGYWESPFPIPAFMCPSPLGVVVQDQPLMFTFEVRDANGALRGSATTTFTPHCPTDTQATHCVAICNG